MLQEGDCWPCVAKSSDFFQDKLEIQIFLKKSRSEELYILAETFFRTLWRPNKTSLCPRCGPLATGLQFLQKYSFWGNLVYMAWFD